MENCEASCLKDPVEYVRLKDISDKQINGYPNASGMSKSLSGHLLWMKECH